MNSKHFLKPQSINLLRRRSPKQVTAFYTNMMITWTGMNKEKQNRYIFIETFSHISMSTELLHQKELHVSTS